MTTGVCMLGCGPTRVIFTNRCGNQIVCDVTESMTALTYGRTLDDTSQAQVTLSVGGDAKNACCDCVGDLRTWLHSMIIYRDGEIVWGPGPVTNLLYKRDTVVVTAQDVSAWMGARVIHNNYTFTNALVSDVVRTLMTDALAPDDPCDLIGRMIITPSTDTQRIDRQVTAGVGWLGDVIRDLARTVMDFTVVGNAFIFDHQIVYGPYSRLTDEDFLTDIEVEERGSEAGTKWYVNGTGVQGVAGGTDPYLGLIEQQATEDSVTTVAHANEAATGHLEASNPAPVYVNIPDGAQLSSNAAVCFSQLVPGTLIDVLLRNTCRPVLERVRLTAVKVSLSAGGAEQVGVSLAPLGTGFTEAAGRVVTIS